jgi:acetyltransferase-like isoleucine patch superfamily enzyme/O-antigen/teichoic acid export membrane protein
MRLRSVGIKRDMTAASFARRLPVQSPLISRLLTGTFWNGLGLALNQGGAFLGSVVVARLLGQIAFGQYAIVLGTLMSVAVLAQTGLAFAATKYIAEFRTIDPARTGRILGLCSVLGPTLAAIFALSMVLAAPWVARPVLGSRNLAAPLAVGAVFVIFYAANSYQIGALTGLERYRALVAPAAICTLLSIAGVATGAKYGGVTGAIAGLSLATAIRWYLHQRTLKTQFQKAGIAVSSQGIWQELPLLYGFAIPAALSGYLMIPPLWLTNAWLVREPDGYAHLAHYAAAQTLRLMVMYVPLLMNSVGLSVLNNVRRGNAGHSYASVHRMNRIALTGSTAVAALVVAACGHSILRMFGSAFAGSANAVLWILLASAVVESASLGYFQAVQAAGRMWLALVAIAIPWQAAFIASAYFLIPRFAAAGLAGAYLTGMSVALMATAITAAWIGKPAVAGLGATDSRRKSNMSIFKILAEGARLARWLHTQYSVRKNPVAYARSLGVVIGEGTHLYGGDTGTFGTEPYLVTIGKNCHIGNEVRFITHDGMAIVLRAHHPDIDLLARIEVGNNVAIGMRAIILPNVRIGSNCIIGCASVVNRDVPDNTIVAGVPARVIGTLEDYERKVVGQSLHTGALHGQEKERRIREIFAVGHAGKGL